MTRMQTKYNNRHLKDKGHVPAPAKRLGKRHRGKKQEEHLAKFWSDQKLTRKALGRLIMEALLVHHTRYKEAQRKAALQTDEAPVEEESSGFFTRAFRAGRRFLGIQRDE